ncbi:MAG: bifunctional UDP-sugar hydrolase/5'-nucleotidase [Synergistaceae bacterium]|nr:bifunctional UDP-sugar hydrolase/5'-nucleotidase [Synergistaceae bacterium]
MRWKFARKVLLAAAAVLLSAALALGADGSVTLLSMNDIHGHIYPENGEGGLAKAATIVQAIREKDPGNTFFLQIGDVNEGPLFFYFHGKAEMRGLSLLGTDAGTLGNHEFDLGEDVLFETVSYARFPIVVSNLRLRDGTPAPFPTHVIRESANGLTVGFFGLVTPELGSMTMGSGHFRAGQDLASEAERMVSLLQEKKCDIIVLLSHCGADVDREIARSVKGIHAILGGHSHTLMEQGEFVEEPGGWVTLIGQAGSYARYVGIMELTLEDGAVDRESSMWRVEKLGKEISEDLRVAWLIEPFREQLNERLSEPLAPQPEDLDARRDTLRRGEAALGSFIADAFRWKTGSDVAFVAGGSIRGDRIYPAGSASYATITNMMPFGGSLWKGSLSGRDLLEVLETSASGYEAPGDGYDSSMRVPTGGFLQVSGIRFTMDPRRQPLLIDNNSVIRRAGTRVIRAEVLQPDGTWGPIQPDRQYSVATTDWTAGGGDKHAAVKRNGASFKSTEQMYLEAVAEYIRFLKEMRSQVDGRIKILE